MCGNTEARDEISEPPLPGTVPNPIVYARPRQDEDEKLDLEDVVGGLGSWLRVFVSVSCGRSLHSLCQKLSV